MNRSKHPKAVLIMNEVDGMSAGDRGGVADLILSIKMSKIPIICICNDQYSQKLKSLKSYCLLLKFLKSTKQQMRKRLAQISKSEGLTIDESALEELAKRANGDMPMAFNQLQYTSLSMKNIKLFKPNAGNLRMDERFDLSMSDPDLVPLLIQGEQNRNRFGGWLGKNSTMGKNYRLLDDAHVHVTASLQFNLGRTTSYLDYLSLLLKHMTDPLKTMQKDEAVEKVVELMDAYSISQADFESLVAMSKFQGHQNLLDGVPTTVKSALTRAYNKGSKSRVIRTADLINLSGIKKAPKKRVAAMLEPVDEGVPEDDSSVAKDEENNSNAMDLEEGDGVEEKPKVDIFSLSSKGIQIPVESKAISIKKALAGRGKGVVVVVLVLVLLANIKDECKVLKAEGRYVLDGT